MIVEWEKEIFYGGCQREWQIHSSHNALPLDEEIKQWLEYDDCCGYPGASEVRKCFIHLSFVDPEKLVRKFEVKLFIVFNYINSHFRNGILMLTMSQELILQE
jgi:hypothetical protein